MFQKVSLLMVSSHFSGSHLSGKGLRFDGCGMPCRRWVSSRPVLSDSCRPFLNADGKAAYWVIAGLVLLIIFSGAVIWYRGSGIADKLSPSVVAPDRKEAFHSPHRYKIERAAKQAVETGAPEAPPQKGGDETAEGPRAVSVTMEAASPVRSSPEKSGPTDQQTATSPPETGQHPVEAVSGGEPISEREQSDGEIRDAGREQPPPDKTAPGPDSSEKPGMASSEETGTSSPQAGGRAGKRFFVKADVANVRDQASMESEVIFQVRNGCSVTVTDKREGWYSVKMDDGRSGWVYHTLLTDSLVPRKDILPAVREIKAIRVEPPVNQTAKVLFELSSPYIPEILMLDEKTSRIVCDFFDATLAPDIGHRIAVNNGIIQTIRIGLHQRPQLKVRMVLDLEPGQRYEPKQVPGDGEDCFVLEIKAVGNP
jgi:SH3-like domain-containing protein